jgi:hypothetical protein
MGLIEWRRHALERMLEREISRAEAVAVLTDGTMITAYPEDRPTPSALFRNDGEPSLHVVAALDSDTSTCYVITVYRPDEKHFEPDLKTARNGVSARIVAPPIAG